MREMETLVMATFGKKTLEELRAEAASKPTGIALEALRANGRRVMMVVCVTDRAQIVRLRRLFDLAGADAPPEDWAQLTLLEIVMRVAAGGGFGFESLHDGSREMSALALISAEPRSMEILETVFRRA